MSIRDFREIAQWALVTAVLVVCLAAGGTAVCEDVGVAAASAPKVSLGGFDLSGVVVSADMPSDKIRVAVSATNPTAKLKPLDLDVTLVRQEFGGDPLSRVAIPNDFKPTIISTKRLQRAIAPSATAVTNVVFSLTTVPDPVKPAPESSPAIFILKGSAASYVVKVSHEGKELDLIHFSASDLKR